VGVGKVEDLFSLELKIHVGSQNRLLRVSDKCELPLDIKIDPLSYGWSAWVCFEPQKNLKVTSKHL
jgi:hypothetical protein